MTDETADRLKAMASQLGAVYTTNDPHDYGAYLSSGDLLISGSTDPLTRRAICFFVEALAAFQDGGRSPYRDHNFSLEEDEE
jgi:hypothetical protein